MVWRPMMRLTPTNPCTIMEVSRSLASERFLFSLRTTIAYRLWVEARDSVNGNVRADDLDNLSYRVAGFCPSLKGDCYDQ
jgi:hypothetical protein